jgi:hypothetical protein
LRLGQVEGSLVLVTGGLEQLVVELVQLLLELGLELLQVLEGDSGVVLLHDLLHLLAACVSLAELLLQLDDFVIPGLELTYELVEFGLQILLALLQVEAFNRSLVPLVL